MATFVNKLTVHGDHETFLAVRNRLTAYMAAQPGYVGHQHLRRLGEGHVYLEIATWQDAAAHRTAFATEGFQQLLAELRPLVSAEPGMYEPVDAQDQAGPEAAGVR
ncbi:MULTISPECIES: antibiotic biosynthesis monooxygenase family protein [unclassified Streptomyces]|uniref:antibiotic biosynthesis monooxygenase family protein n=1 Tax=unclassified Streptomyces TaxID=2593676 RepID=UPI0032569C91|nr:antibiotic biosynthesis monooxygenase [Streptomyces sp. NBC_00885]